MIKELVAKYTDTLTNSYYVTTFSENHNGLGIVVGKWRGLTPK